MESAMGATSNLQRELSPSWGEDKVKFERDVHSSGRYMLGDNDGYFFLDAGAAQMRGEPLTGGRRRPINRYLAEEFCTTRFDTPVVPWDRSIVVPSTLQRFADRVVRDISNPVVLSTVMKLIADAFYAALVYLFLQWASGRSALEDALNADNPVIVMVSTFLASVLVRAVANSPESREDTCRRMLADWRDTHDAAEVAARVFRKSHAYWATIPRVALDDAHVTGDAHLRHLSNGSSPLRLFWSLKLSLAAIANLTSLVHSDLENRCTDRAIENHGFALVEETLQGNDDPLSAISEALLRYARLAKNINAELNATAKQAAGDVVALHDSSPAIASTSLPAVQPMHNLDINLLSFSSATPPPVDRHHHRLTPVVEMIPVNWAIDMYNRRTAADRTLYAWRGVFVEKSIRENAQWFLTVFFYVLVPIPLWYSLKFLMTFIYPIVRYLFNLLLGHMQHRPSLINLNNGEPTRNVFTLHESTTLEAVGRIGAL